MRGKYSPRKLWITSEISERNCSFLLLSFNATLNTFLVDETERKFLLFRGLFLFDWSSVRILITQQPNKLRPRCVFAAPRIRQRRDYIILDATVVAMLSGDARRRVQFRFSQRRETREEEILWKTSQPEQFRSISREIIRASLDDDYSKSRRRTIQLL